MKIIAVFALLVGITTSAQAGTIGSDVEVQVRTDNGRTLPLYPAASASEAKRAYAEAVKGENYSILVRNRLNRRIGIVVAVDGRNIISGKKSWLRNNERMYILEPYGSGEFSGWRTGSDRINRFYFTSAADSYAASFRDESAMGVIAVAVYPEVRRYDPPWYDSFQEMNRDKGARSAAPSARAEEKSAGTGYGREEYSPSTVVAFEPESHALEKIFLKYEWRATLCKKGIIRCGWKREPDNRLWDEDGFAPPPGRY
ncbi:MAG: hypothetical protein EG822_05160 [Deltaproteobacteria bacterium]|nr:hypothetical protein [Deltaproteobacteria bacterium]TLN04414.1 MAG: hypothetical protein FDZ73_03780 [bacterium]